MSEVVCQENKIIEMAQQGEREAFSLLVEKYKEKAFALCYHFSKNYEDARDILQASFLKAYVNINSFNSNASFYTWFYRIIVNSSMDYLRQKRKSRGIFAEQADLQSFDGELLPKEAKDKRFNPRQHADANNLKEVMSAAIERLPEKQKVAFILKYMQYLKIYEIALILKCRQATVKVRLFRAVQNLQRILQPIGEEMCLTLKK